MRVTVAICTWNRAKLLDQTLSRMQELRVPPGIEWELLIVNNNCADDTDEVIGRHSGRLPIRRLFEEKQGLSNARNCAVNAATGGLLLWTDDDVLVPACWLTEYVQAAADYPYAAIFGGPVRPWWEAPPASWIRNNLGLIGYTWALLDFGDTVRLLSSDEYVHGANMGFRTEILRQMRFDPSLGRIGNDLLSGDEIVLWKELKFHGHHGAWVGSAPVEHYITANRLTARYVWDLHCGLGRQSTITGQCHDGYPSLFGLPRWLLRQYWQARCASFILAPTGSTRWLKAFVRAAILRGALDEIRSLRSRPAIDSRSGTAHLATVVNDQPASTKNPAMQ